MSPTISNGDLVEVMETNKFNKGDIILFYEPLHKSFYVHRIHDIVRRNGLTMFVVKADNADTPDPTLVQRNQIIGIVTNCYEKKGSCNADENVMDQRKNENINKEKKHDDKSVPIRMTNTFMRTKKGETIVLDRYLGHPFWLNETASAVWELCNGKNSIEDIIKLLLASYNIDEATLKSHVNDTLCLLEKLKLIFFKKYEST